MRQVESFDHYQELALRTLNDKGYLMNILHCAMGMCGEIGEYASLPAHHDARTAEIGDCMWYSAVLAKQLDLRFSHLWASASELWSEMAADTIVGRRPPEIQGLIVASELIDTVKKYVFYNKEVDKFLVENLLRRYLLSLVGMCNRGVITPLQVAESNILKLRARFPDKYSDDRANNRDYDGESAASGTPVV